jgi:hypothetical protein
MATKPRGPHSRPPKHHEPSHPHPGGNLIVDWMRRHNIPLTRERYRALAHFPDLPPDLSPEEEADLPEELQDWSQDFPAEADAEDSQVPATPPNRRLEPAPGPPPEPQRKR